MGQLLKRVLVGLDFTAMDESIIKFAACVARRNESTEVYFVHILKNLKYPEEITSEFPDIEEKVIEEKENALKAYVDKHWDKNLDAQLIFRAKKGKVAKNLLKVIDANDIDIAVIGKSLKSKERGLLAQKLARMANCQLLIVPEGCEPKFKKLLVPVNHSDNDRIALEKAIDIVSLSGPDAVIICQNIYSVPVGYHYTGKDFNDFAKVMNKHTQKKYKMLINSIDTKGVNIKPVYSLDQKEDPIEEVYDMALREDPDAIVLGAKGQSSATAMFLSSVAEKLIQVDTKFPIRIVRKKGEHEGIMEFIKKI